MDTRVRRYCHYSPCPVPRSCGPLIVALDYSGTLVVSAAAARLGVLNEQWPSGQEDIFIRRIGPLELSILASLP